MLFAVYNYPVVQVNVRSKIGNQEKEGPQKQAYQKDLIRQVDRAVALYDDPAVREMDEERYDLDGLKEELREQVVQQFKKFVEELPKASHSAFVNGPLRNTMAEQKEGYYDLIFMDMQMPVMDGCEAAAAIRQMERERKRNRAVPIVALTASVFAEDSDRALAAGMNAHLGKPVELPKLLGMMVKYILHEKRE